jgi:hypothetical protein
MAMTAENNSYLWDSRDIDLFMLKSVLQLFPLKNICNIAAVSILPNENSGKLQKHSLEAYMQCNSEVKGPVTWVKGPVTWVNKTAICRNYKWSWNLSNFSVEICTGFLYLIIFSETCL